MLMDRLETLKIIRNETIKEQSKKITPIESNNLKLNLNKKNNQRKKEKDTNDFQHYLDTEIDNIGDNTYRKR